jgi:TRAP-type C4-dicarboxylate transport system permease small subunit
MRRLSIGRILKAAEDASATLAVAAFMAIVLITVSDAFLRYAFNRPLWWSFPAIANYLMASAFVFGLAQTQRVRGHIEVEVLRSRISDRLHAVSSLASGVIGAVFCATVAVVNMPLVFTAIAGDERIPSEPSWPMWPSYVILPAGFALLALRFATQGIRALLAFVRGEPPERMDHGPAEHGE